MAPKRQSKYKNLRVEVDDDRAPSDGDYEKVAKKFSSSASTSSNLESIKMEALNLIQAYDNGISETAMANTMSSTKNDERSKVINMLLSEGKIELYRKGSELIYRAIDSRHSANHSAILNSSDISVEEKVVYKVIETAGSKGIWNRDIYNQTKIPHENMKKALAKLVGKKLIKAVKSVTASKKRLYMLYGLEPDKSITGGAWYSGTEFESEYVQVLHEQCYQYIKRRLTTASESKDFLSAREASLVSSQEVKEYIDELKISTVKLSLADIETVLETIVYDGLIEKISVAKEASQPQPSIVKADPDAPATTTPVDMDHDIKTSDDEDLEQSNFTHYYRALSKLVTSSGVMRVPCGQCPYIHECKPGAVINPESCLYIERWFAT